MRVQPCRGAPVLPLTIAVVLWIAVCSSRLDAQGAGEIRGQVRSEGSDTPIASAVVEIIGLAQPYSVASDGSGRYQMADVPSGRRRVRARHIGHAPLEVEVVVPAGGSVRLDLSLSVLPIALDPVRVDAGRPSGLVDTTSAPSGVLDVVGARAMGSGPGISELGLAQVAEGVPGQEPPDPTDLLYVRGTGADLKLVYLDGAPVYAPFPLGGIADVFVPGLLTSAKVFLGGAPARYDGGLSYVMDLRTRGVRADRVHVSGAADLLSGRLMVEGPLAAGVSVLGSGRAVHGSGAIQPLPYSYAEGLVRVDAALSGGAHLSATGFTNDEEVRIAEDADRDSAIAWGNRAASLRFVAPVLGGDVEVVASTGSYEARLPLERAEPVVATGGARRDRVTIDMSRRTGDGLLRYGASVDRMVNRYRAKLRDGAEVEAEVRGAAAGTYVDFAWQASQRVLLRGGLRADHFSGGAAVVLAPRFSATLMATERTSLTAAAGRYNQYLRAPDGAVLFAGADSAAVPGLAVGGSSHLTVSMDQEIAEGARLGVEGFFKSFEGLPTTPRSNANSSGVDLWLTRDRGRWTGWAGYSLAWVWSATGERATDLFAGRHLLSAGAGAPLTAATRLEGRVAYGSGLPYAAIPLASPSSPESFDDLRSRDPVSLTSGTDAAPLVPRPDRAYLRLDLSATHTSVRRLGGREIRLDSYLKLLNTLGRRDALFYRYDPNRGESLSPLAALPIVPVFGLEWRF